MDAEVRKILIAELVTIQNQPHNMNRDILTITGFMSTEEELQNHINRNRGTAK